MLWKQPVPYWGVRDKSGWGVCTLPDEVESPVYIGTESGYEVTFMNTKAEYGCTSFSEKGGVSGTIHHSGLAQAQ